MSTLFLFLTVVQALVAAALVGVILMQQSEGGGLGMGGSPSGMLSARGAADFMTRTTTILAVLFVALSITLAAIAAGKSDNAAPIENTLDRSAPVEGTAPATTPVTGGDPLNAAGLGGEQPADAVNPALDPLSAAGQSTGEAPAEKAPAAPKKAAE